jgi:hypothetical protein
VQQAKKHILMLHNTSVVLQIISLNAIYKGRSKDGVYETEI